MDDSLYILLCILALTRLLCKSGVLFRLFSSPCVLQIVGCDHELGSTAKEDNCGVCNGDGSSCRLVRGHYKTQHASGKSKESLLRFNVKNYCIFSLLKQLCTGFCGSLGALSHYKIALMSSDLSQAWAW